MMDGHFSTGGRPGTRLTLMLGVRDRAHHRSLVATILARARSSHLAGATVFAGWSGFGASGKTHHGTLLTDDAPLTVVIVDNSESIRRFLDEIADLLDQVRAVTDDVEILDLHRPGPPV